MNSSGQVLEGCDKMGGEKGAEEVRTSFLRASSVSGTPSMTESPLQITPAECSGESVILQW